MLLWNRGTRHQTRDFLFSILKSDLILGLAKEALSVSDVMNLDITGRESIWRVLPLPISSWLSPLFLSHPVIPICAPLFHRKQQEQYPLYCRQTAASDIDTPLPFVYSKHCLSQEKETIWIPPSWSVYSPCKASLWTQYPNRESYFLQWPCTSPFHQEATMTKAPCCKRSFLARWYLAGTAENRRCGNGLWDGTFTKSVLSLWVFSWLVILCEQEWSHYTILQGGLSTVCNPNSEH